MTNTLYTLGLKDRSLQDIVNLLAAAEIKTMVDIRPHADVDLATPLSAEALRDALTAVGREYHWAGRHLANARAPAADSPHTALTDTILRAYADHMSGTMFTRAIAQLQHLASLAPTVLVGTPRAAANCHRSLIADYLTLRGAHVVHLLDAVPGEPHMLRPEVRRESAELIYDRQIASTK